MNGVAPLEPDQRKSYSQPVRRLGEAFKQVHGAYHKQPTIQPDGSDEFEAVCAWRTVTCSYSGIEQAMKCLMKMRGLEVPRGNEGHRIGWLFEQLAPQEQHPLRVSYDVYRSLHYYIPPETADECLDTIDNGYSAWRYLLLELEDKVPPATHPGAMLEIWSALTDILDARVNYNHGLETVQWRIEERLKGFYVDALGDQLSELFELSELGDQLSDIGQSQINKMTAQLNEDIAINYCAEFLYRDARDQSLSSDDQLSDSPVLPTLIDKIKRYTTDHDFSYYVQRARTNKLAWNPRPGRFESG